MPVSADAITPKGVHVVTLEVSVYNMGETSKTTYRITREHVDFGDPSFTNQNVILWSAAEVSKTLRLSDPRQVRFVSHSYESPEYRVD